MLTQSTRQNLRPVELIPAIGYIRVSTWFEEKISDEIQKASIEEGARRRGRTIVRWIVDLDATGRNFKRKIMQGIEAVEAGTIEGAREIWVWKYSRFGRNRHGVAVNLARIEAAGGQLISATEDVDTSTATGGLTRDMLFAIAQFESNRIGEQWREAHEYRRVHGLPSSGRPRFGYLWHQRVVEDGILKSAEQYEPDPDTIETVRGLYENYTFSDATFQDLVDVLNENSIRNPAAVKDIGWSRQSLSFYLDCGFPAGFLHAHRNDITCPRRQTCPPSGDHYGFLPGAQPAIISDDLWAAYREKRQRRQDQPPRARVAQYPYSGLVKCGLCGGGAGAASVHGQRGYVFRCVTRYSHSERECPGAIVLSSRIEADVKVWLKKAAVAIDRQKRGTVVTPPRQQVSDDARKRERLAAELAKIQKGLDRASMAHVMGDMPREQYLRVRDELTAKREGIDAQLGVLAGDAEANSKLAWEVRGAVIGSLLEEWDTLSVPAKRDLLSRALKEIRLFPAGTEQRVVPVPRDGFVL